MMFIYNNLYASKKRKDNRYLGAYKCICMCIYRTKSLYITFAAAKLMNF